VASKATAPKSAPTTKLAKLKARTDLVEIKAQLTGTALVDGKNIPVDLGEVVLLRRAFSTGSAGFHTSSKLEDRSPKAQAIAAETGDPIRYQLNFMAIAVGSKEW